MFEKLEQLSLQLSARYERADLAWRGSPFAWIKSRPSSQKGKIAEELVAGLCDIEGLIVLPSPDSDADRIVEGTRVEIKSSTLWASGEYKFQQLRDQNYEIAVCLGLSPFTAHFWALPKKVLLKHWQAGSPGIKPQHGGRGGIDTAWINLSPEDPPIWMQPYGGSLDEGMTVFRSLLDT
ncbi:MAG: hypothetical protein F4124_03705 [Acidimicrobiia bacterium]|nr:hypothetical protein [Acidimicrobiia bacterium]MYB75376.1 hypothetical protein [Acidimicrobiia bacterium]MYH98522.1 hypothetical protein [Acidimicrobiia bacterium]